MNLSNDFIEYSFKDISTKSNGLFNFDEFFPQQAIEEAMRETLDELEKIIISHFTSRQGQWKPLKAATIQARIRERYAASPILVRSGTLRDHVASGHEVDVNSGSVRGGVFPGDATAPGSNTPIDEYLEKLDRDRPFYDLTSDEENHLSEFFMDKLFEKAGLG